MPKKASVMTFQFSKKEIEEIVSKNIEVPEGYRVGAVRFNTYHDYEDGIELTGAEIDLVPDPKFDDKRIR